MIIDPLMCSRWTVSLSWTFNTIYKDISSRFGRKIIWSVSICELQDFLTQAMQKKSLGINWVFISKLVNIFKFIMI